MNQTRTNPAEPDFDRDVEAEALIAQASDLIAETMQETGMSKSELARRLGVSRAHITQTLSGERNLTLRTIAEILYTLGRRLECHSLPLEDEGNQETPYRVPNRVASHHHDPDFWWSKRPHEVTEALHQVLTYQIVSAKDSSTRRQQTWAPTHGQWTSIHVFLSWKRQQEYRKTGLSA